MSHTKGPWVAEEKVTGRPPEAGCGVVASEDDVEISNPSRGIVAWATRTVGRSNHETMANARLIAAAPDLLDLAESFLASAAESSDLSWLSVAAKAAIAKANGEVER